MKLHRLRRTALFKLLVGWMSASVILSGCGGQTNSAGLPLLAASSLRSVASYPGRNEVHWWVNIHNDTGLPRDLEHPNGNYLWVTRYYSKGLLEPWIIKGADCIAPHQTILRDVPFYRSNELKAVKLRVEVKAYDATGCNAPNISDFESPECYLRFNYTDQHGEEDNLDWILGYASIDVIPPHFHIGIRCETASGRGDLPGPGFVRKYGGE